MHNTLAKLVMATASSSQLAGNNHFVEAWKAGSVFVGICFQDAKCVCVYVCKFNAKWYV